MRSGCGRIGLRAQKRSPSRKVNTQLNKDMAKSIADAPELSSAAKLWALVVSFIVVALGVTWTWKIGQESNLLYHQVVEIMDSVDGVTRILEKEGIAH